MGDEKMIRVTFTIPPDLHLRASSRAKAEGTTFSAVVRGFLDRWLAGVLPSPRDLPVQLELFGMPAGMTLVDMLARVGDLDANIRELTERQMILTRRLERLEGGGDATGETGP